MNLTLPFQSSGHHWIAPPVTACSLRSVSLCRKPEGNDGRRSQSSFERNCSLIFVGLISRQKYTPSQAQSPTRCDDVRRNYKVSCLLGGRPDEAKRDKKGKKTDIFCLFVPF